MQKSLSIESGDDVDAVLVFSKPPDLYKSQTCPPLGVCYLASVLEQSGFHVSIVDLSVRDMDYSEAASAIASSNPLVVGFSCTTPGFPSAVRVAQRVREKIPGAKIIFGGPFPTFAYDEILSKYPCVDVVVRGEGEETLLELTEYFIRGTPISLNSIAGIAYRSNGSLVVTPERPFIQDLDSIPFPAYHLLDDLKEYGLSPDIIFSRGCPFGCAFCSSTVMWGKKTRFRSVQNIIDEIEFLNEDFSITDFWFVDDTFTLDKKRTLRLCAELEKFRPLLSWGCVTRADLVDEELLHAMAKAGCKSVQYGIESANPKTMKMLGKKIFRKEVEEKVYMARKVGLDVFGSFIIGFPGETREMIEETLEFAESLPLSDTQVNIALPFLGTRLRDELVPEYDSKVRHNDWEYYHQSQKERSAIIENPQLPVRDLLELFLRGRMINYKKAGILEEIFKS